MYPNLNKLHNKIAAVCPITSVIIGNPADKSTWAFSPADTATAEQKNAAQTLIDAADLSILKDPVVWTAYEFRNRFTQSERIAIIDSQDSYVKDFWTGLMAAQEVIADNSDTVNGMAYLVTVGLITESRKTEILN